MIETERLILRPWRDADREPFARITADPRVMEFFPAVLTREQSDALIDRCDAHYREHGFTFFAAELRATGELIGFIGLARTPIAALRPARRDRLAPCVRALESRPGNRRRARRAALRFRTIEAPGNRRLHRDRATSAPAA